MLLVQLVYFSYLFYPYFSSHLIVKGLACTCPDETIMDGQAYLKTITPDSLKKYNLDYSEIYVTEMPCTNSDPMGVNQYIIKGKVIGKDRVSKDEPWNPKFRIDSWREHNIKMNYLIIGIFSMEIIIFGIFYMIYRKNK